MAEGIEPMAQGLPKAAALAARDRTGRGSTGGRAAGTRRTGTASFTAESFSWHHFLDLAIFPDRLEGRAVNQDDRVADAFVLHP